MVREKFPVRLTPEEREQLERLVRVGRGPAQAITRARIPLKVAEGWTAALVAAALEVSERTVFRIRRRFAGEGLEAVPHRHNQVNRYRKLDDRAAASSPWPVALRPRGRTTGRCGPWRTRQWNWGWLSLCPTR